jgi:hypothetical protein
MIGNAVCSGITEVVAGTTYRCVTLPKVYGSDSSISASQDNYQVAIMPSAKFIQFYYWSDADTWNGDFPPQDGDSVYIPAGMNVLVDSDSIGVLRAVLIEGSLVFKPEADQNHIRTFDAYYILVKDGGLM